MYYINDISTSQYRTTTSNAKNLMQNFHSCLPHPYIPTILFKKDSFPVEFVLYMTAFDLRFKINGLFSYSNLNFDEKQKKHKDMALNFMGQILLTEKSKHTTWTLTKGG